MSFLKTLLKQSKTLLYLEGTMKINYLLTPTTLECGFTRK